MDVMQTFLVAAIVAAVLFADRLGGADELTRRFFQVALGLALAFAVVSGTTAFLRTDTGASFADLLRGGNSSQAAELFAGGSEGANRAREADSVQIALALALVVIGVGWQARFRTLSLGALLGGVLLLLFGGGQGGGFDPNALGSSALFSSLLGRADEAQDIVHFVVTAGGAAILLVYGYWRWDQPAVEPSPSASSPST